MDRINHVAIPVNDIAGAVKWYQDSFSCNVAYLDDTWALLDFENISLALVLPEQHAGHFAIERKDAANFGSLTLHRDKTKSVYIEDPWSNNLEILQINKNG